jgi:hypothetical protein
MFLVGSVAQDLAIDTFLSEVKKHYNRFLRGGASTAQKSRKYGAGTRVITM